MILPKMIRAGVFLALAAFANLAAAGKDACPPVAVQPTPEMVQAAMHNARDHGFLWRISKDGHTSFLYGTIHVAKFDWMFPGPSVMQALRASDTVALELDMMDADIQRRIREGMSALHSSALPEPLVKRLQRQAELVCVPYDTLTTLTPEFQITTLTLMAGRWEGLFSSYAIDGVLAGIGHGARKLVVSLETPEAQLQVLQMQSPQETVAFVEDGLKELEAGGTQKTFSHIARVWAGSDYADLSRYDEWCDCLNTSSEREEMKRLLDERNPNLAAGIDTLHMSGKRVFAAVGSLHMFGPLGLPALMEKRGYRVERVELRPL
ncbi:TraB/GumN family protein [Sideroxydans lithotrophicus]|uniref:GumN family protein n=1 Tax=Sideroxydans lithotrophicus (strain ES-1) TaxID=580332 RepID=D5CR92_SIDLE|nr:TraB/GumN family protein [Sideroxydans lithotrophicus]ADE11478.1 GumN family protein [Sideroxydans lithotrophicus ES-1]